MVDSATLFGVRALIAGKRQDLVAGTLKMKRDMSYGAALAKLSGSAVDASFETTSLVIQEGLSIRENARKFKRQDILEGYGATRSASSRSGARSCAPSTRCPRRSTRSRASFPGHLRAPGAAHAGGPHRPPTAVVPAELQHDLPLQGAEGEPHAYEVLIIASMVEREARLTRERPIIAAVIYNRLKAGMPLGIDATFRYASGDWVNPIRQSELEKDGPYNSRTRQGLPPTPIGNPGLASIEAAAKPANVDYLFFVVKPAAAASTRSARRSRSSTPIRRSTTRPARPWASRPSPADLRPARPKESSMSVQARYGVVGWPVSHSRSPAMHRALGLDYQLLPVPPDRAEAVLRALPASGFAGVNVTIPHKAAALAVADEASDAATAIGAANTLIYRADGTIYADNTDAPGLLATLEGRPQRTAVVLGAGGSARAVVWALVSVGCEVRVWNRTLARAEELPDRSAGSRSTSQPMRSHHRPTFW